MSQDLLNQLAEYGAYCAQRQGPVAVDEIERLHASDLAASSAGSIIDAADSVHPETCGQCGAELTVLDLLRPAEPTTPETSKRRSTMVGAVAAAILLVVGVVLLADGNGGNVVTELASSRNATDPVTDPVSAPAVADGLGYRWTQVADEAVLGGELADVTAGGPGLVAVGNARSGDAAVWTSVDGFVWTRVPHDEDVFGGARVRAVTAGGPGLVAVGDDRGFAVVWTSVDGFTWSRVPRDDEVFRGADMLGVSVGGPGLVAFGGTGNSDTPTNPQVGSAVVWTSVDGVTWSRVPHDEGVFGGEDAQAIIDVAVGGPGLVAVGGDFSGGGWDNGFGSAAVWTSVDGVTWSRAPRDEIVFGNGEYGWMTTVTGGGPGLVAGGPSGIWTSVDGLTWSREAPSGAFDIADVGAGLVSVGSVVRTSVDGLTWVRGDSAVLGEMRSVTVGGPGLVAVGGKVWVATPENAPDPDLSGCGLSPTSTSTSWSRVCLDAVTFDGAAMWGVTAGGPGLVAVGGDYRVWTPTDLQPLLEEGGEGDAVVWTSPDGISWARVPFDETVFGGDGAQQIYAVTVGGPGLVAVGLDGTLDNENGNAAVWTSPDGFAWTRVPHDEAVFGGEDWQVMLSVTAGGPGLVAVGVDGRVGVDGTRNGDADAAVWTSPDGFAWSRVPHDEAIFGGDDEQQMAGVTVGGPGLVAVGSDGMGHDGNWPGDAAVWTSPDGLAWSRVADSEGVLGGAGDQRMLSITAGGPGLVAVGLVKPSDDPDEADAAVWTSLDGIAWSRVPHDEAIFGNEQEGVWPWEEEIMRSVTVGGQGLIAVGAAGADESGFNAAVWTSLDGIAWSRVPHDEAIFGGNYKRVFGVAMGSSGVVMVGSASGGVDRAAAVWVAPEGSGWSATP